MSLHNSWTFYGYDASAHIAEETKGAAKTASRGMYTSVATAFVFSFAMLIILLFALQDTPGEDGVLIPYSGVDAVVAGYAIYPQPIVVVFLAVLGEQGAVAFSVLLFMVGFNCSVACAMSGRFSEMRGWLVCLCRPTSDLFPFGLFQPSLPCHLRHLSRQHPSLLALLAPHV